MRKALLAAACLSFAACLIASGAAAGADKQIILPKPRTEGGKPLMQALKARQSQRSFSEKKLPLQVLSDLLWAAHGVNRPGKGKRTAPSAMNWQEIDVYVVLEEGTYLYEAKKHALDLVVPKDLRPLTGRQGFVNKAPLNLVYVADLSRMTLAPRKDRELYSAVDTGFISQNVYLYCASEGLATVVRGWIDRDDLAKAMNLKESQRIIVAQTVGYPE